MNLYRPFAIALLSATTLLGCGAEAPVTGSESSESQEAQMTLVGSYPMAGGGSLDVYESITPGDFVIGERVPAGKGEANPAVGEISDQDSLPEIYRSMVGSDRIPPELEAAEARRLQFVARAANGLLPPRVRTPESAAGAQLPVVDQHSGDFQLKEAVRDVAGFRLYRCRETSGAKKTFTYCHTERTGDREDQKNDIHGSYTAARPYRGTITYSVQYNLTGWENAFSVTVYEGETYHARKVGPVRDYDIRTRITNASGDGYNLAVIGTNNRGEKGCYSSYDSIACVVIAGAPF